VAERSEIAQELLAEVRVRDKAIVSVKLAREEYLPLVAVATARDDVGGVPPDGHAGAPPTVIVDGLEAMLAALAA
jgi:hypothetical protein